MRQAVQLGLALLAVAAAEPCLTPPQIRQLVVEAMKHTPEHTHFAEGATFSWVIVQKPENDACPEFTSALREELKKHYRIYASTAELPANAIHRNQTGTAYVGGFIFTVTVKRVSANEVEVQYNDFEAPLAASSQTVRYRWSFRRWWATSTGGLAVS